MYVCDIEHCDTVEFHRDIVAIRNVYTLMPTCMGESPAKGILLVAISHRMTAKLYMSAALLSMSSGRCCRAVNNNNNNNKRVYV